MPDILAGLKQSFAAPAAQLQSIAVRFQSEIEDGLAGNSSSLKMLRSLLGVPTGGEKGDFLSLDLGGTNARAVWIKLLGNGRYIQKQREVISLNSGRDYRSELVQAHELFSFLAELVEQLARANPGGYEGLGFTFSFPYRQLGHTRAELVQWTKEFRTAGVVGKNVGQLLQDALTSRNLPAGPELKVVINDTVGTLLTASYNDRDAHVGSILGTGHNTCYLEPHEPDSGEPMIINLESGNFGNLPITPFDAELDRESGNPGQQRLEKMVSGKYLGEIFRLAVRHLIRHGFCLGQSMPQFFDAPYSLSSEDMSTILADTSAPLAGVRAWFEQQAAVFTSTYSDRAVLKGTALMIAQRSSRLAAATYLGILRHLDPELGRHHTIAIDGSLYEKMPGYAANLAQALSEILGGKSALVTVKPVHDASQVGAAIAAAMLSAGTTQSENPGTSSI